MEFSTVSYQSRTFFFSLRFLFLFFFPSPCSLFPLIAHVYTYVHRAPLFLSRLTVSLSSLQQERSSIILHLSSMRPGDFRDFWIEISIAADNAAVRGQLHSLMDPPHITVTYTYVSFVKSEYRQRPFYVSSYDLRLKREIDVLYFTCLPAHVIGLHRVPPFLLSSCSAWFAWRLTRPCTYGIHPPGAPARDKFTRQQVENCSTLRLLRCQNYLVFREVWLSSLKLYPFAQLNISWYKLHSIIFFF